MVQRAVPTIPLLQAISKGKDTGPLFVSSDLGGGALPCLGIPSLTLSFYFLAPKPVSMTLDSNRLGHHCDLFFPLEWATSHGTLKRREREAAGTRPLPGLSAHCTSPENLWQLETENEYIFPSLHWQPHIVTDPAQQLVLVRVEGWGHFRRKTARKQKVKRPQLVNISRIYE